MRFFNKLCNVGLKARICLAAFAFIDSMNATNYFLNSQQSESKNLNVTCTYYQCLIRDDINYQTMQGGSSNLTLNAAIPAGSNPQNKDIIFYASSTTIGANSNLTLNGVATIGLGQAFLHLKPNASFKQNGGLQIVNTILESGSMLSFSEVFHNYVAGRLEVYKNAKIGEATNNANHLYNNSLVINNGEIHIKKLSNIGQQRGQAILESGIAVIENNGIINISGDAKNGGVYNTGTDGAGILNINSGSKLSVSGTLSNESGGGLHSAINVRDGGLLVAGILNNNANNSVKIDGTLEVKGQIRNSGFMQISGIVKAGAGLNNDGTLRWAADLNGNLGKIEGNLQNQANKGILQVEATGLDINKTHILTTSGLQQNQAITLLNNGVKNDLLSYTINNNAIKLNDLTSDASGGLAKNLQEQLSQNESKILSSIKENIPNLATFYSNTEQLKTLSKDYNEALENSISTSIGISNLLSTLKGFNKLTSTRLSSFRTYPKYASLSYDVMRNLPPLTFEESIQLDIGYSLIRQDSKNAGNITNIGIWGKKSIYNHTLIPQVTFNNISLNTPLSSFSFDKQGNMLSLGLSDNINFDRFDLIVGIAGIYGLMQESMKNAALQSSSKADYNVYQGELSVVVSKDLLKTTNLLIKPYVGISSGILSRGKIDSKQEGRNAIGIDSKSFSNIYANAIVGALGEIRINQNVGLFSTISHTQNMLNSQDFIEFNIANSSVGIKYNLPNDYRSDIKLGVQINKGTAFATLQGIYRNFKDFAAVEGQMAIGLYF